MSGMPLPLRLEAVAVRVAHTPDPDGQTRRILLIEEEIRKIRLQTFADQQKARQKT